MTELVGTGTEEGTSPFTWWSRKCPSCDWVKVGQIGGDKTTAKEAMKTYRDSITSMWASGDTRDFKLVSGEQATMIESSYVDPKTEGDLTGECPEGQSWDATTQACIPIPPPPVVDEYEQYYPWIYAAVAIGVASFIIYLMFFGANPIVNRIQAKVVS